MRTFPSFPWLTDEGWPYADPVSEQADPFGEPDEDRLCLVCAGPHLFDGLDPLERDLVMARFGLGGTARKSLNELRHDTGMSRAEVRHTLGAGLAKLRARLS